MTTQAADAGISDAVRVRFALPDDGDQIAPLVEQLGYPTSAAEMRARLEAMDGRPDYQSWVAEAGRVVGFAGACVGYSFVWNPPYGRVIALVVDETLRGRGIGATLLAEAERWIAGRGADVVVVSSGNHRIEAHRFYEGLGYTMTGVRLSKKLSPATGQSTLEHT